MSLVKKLLSRFVRHEVYSSMNGAQLKHLDVGATENLKQMPEMKTWCPQEKKSFRTGAQAFYIATAKRLLKQLPLDNKLLMHLRFLNPCLTLSIEETTQSLKYGAACVCPILSSPSKWHCW